MAKKKATKKTADAVKLPHEKKAPKKTAKKAAPVADVGAEIQKDVVALQKKYGLSIASLNAGKGKVVFSARTLSGVKFTGAAEVSE